MNESRFEHILHHRRKVEPEKFDPAGDFTPQDAVSLGLTNPAQSAFLKLTLSGLDRIEKICNRRRTE